MCISVYFLVPLLSNDPVPIILFTETTNLFYPGLQSLMSLSGEGWDVLFLSSCTVLIKVLMEAEQPPEYAAMIIEL